MSAKAEKRKAKEVLGFDDRLFMLIGMPVIALMLPFVFPAGPDNTSLHVYLVKAGISLVFVMFYWLMTRLMLIRARRMFPHFTQTRKRLIMVGAFVGVLVLLISLICDPFLKDLLVKMYNNRSLVFNQVGMALESFILCVSVIGIYESIYAIYRWRQTQVEAEKLRRENVQAQLDMLRNQVNPHFLFNSLNTLTSLVHDNPDLSVEFIQKLSRTYRYVLEIRDRELIQLEEEMECVRAYLFLLEIRFGASLSVEMNLDPSALSLWLAPLSLQLLIENAIKHNVVSKNKPLHIRISVENGNRLVVRNNLQKKEQEISGTRSGLDNIRNRYHLLVKQEITVQDGPAEFIVTLPLIKLEKYASGDH